MKHTRECLEEQARYHIELCSFFGKHPHYCKTCGGTGELRTIENGAPWGEGFWAMPISDPCDDCYGISRCPLCGTQHKDEWCEDDVPCPVCGWKWGDYGVTERPDMCFCEDYPLIWVD